MKKKLIYSTLYLSILFLVLLSCKKDEKEVIPAPTANFTFAADAADASKINFTNSSTNFKSVSWNFGDQSAAMTEENPTHTYATPGTYKVELSVLGKDGSTVKATKEVTIATIAAPTADFTFTADPANASMIKFTNTSTNFNTVSWNFGDQSAAMTEENPTHTYAASGTYTVELTVTGKDGSTVKATKDVTIGNGAPTSVIVNGDFATADNWTAVKIVGRDETTHAIADGALTFTGTGIVNKLIYQEVQLEAGEYQFSAHVKGDGSAIFSWLEFYLLDAKPGTELDDPSNAFIGWLTFEPCQNNVIDGKIEATETCTTGTNKNGKIAIPLAGKYYVGIKCGAWENGKLGTGVIVDDVSLIKQ